MQTREGQKDSSGFPDPVYPGGRTWQSEALPWRNQEAEGENASEGLIFPSPVSAVPIPSLWAGAACVLSGQAFPTGRIAPSWKYRPDTPGGMLEQPSASVSAQLC